MFSSTTLTDNRPLETVETIVGEKKTFLTNTANKLNLHFKLFILVLRSMDSLAHLMLNATN